MTLREEDRRIVYQVIGRLRAQEAKSQHAQRPVRKPPPLGRCHLCGGPARGAYCVGHDWAYGR